MIVMMTKTVMLIDWDNQRELDIFVKRGIIKKTKTGIEYLKIS